MPESFFLGLSHLALAGTGIYCLTQIKDEKIGCPHVSYTIISVNNIFGFCSWITESPLKEIYKFTSYCQILFVLPCMTSAIWLQNGYPPYWSWAWAIVPIFPLICFLLDADSDSPLKDILILLNLVGIGVVSFVKELKYGMAATLSYAVAHCCFRRAEVRYTALYNCTLCIFTYFSLETIGFGHDVF